MNKDHIIDEIRRTSRENGGSPLGERSFRDKTGISRANWERHWPRWSEALKEAGYEPNKRQDGYDEEFLLGKIVDLIREKGSYPSESEFRFKHKSDSSFPATQTLHRRLGVKYDILNKVAQYCRKHADMDDVLTICEETLSNTPPPEEKDDALPEDSSALKRGHVYLLKHQKAYKIGRSEDVTRRYREIGIQMPHETEEIHKIETDDTVGIEKYWHNRFDNKRLKGEWFNLTAADVRAFKKRKFM